MKSFDNIWSHHPEVFMDETHTSQQHVLHPKLASLINEENPSTLLDFGCGDGRILKLLNSHISIDVYDKNEKMLELAARRVGNRISEYFSAITDVPSNRYEAVLLSMVLVCIDNKEEYLEVLTHIHRAKQVDGKVFIALSHPCFRDKSFSNFSTSYGDQQPFAYLSEGSPFHVAIKDTDRNPVVFTDYHWSLSFTLNKIIEAGMRILSIIETTDDMQHPAANSLQSPFIIIIAQ